MIWGITHDTRALGGRTVGVTVSAVGGTLGQGEGTRATVSPGHWLGRCPEKAGSIGDARQIVVQLLYILSLQQSACLIGRLATLGKKHQSQHALKSAFLLLSIRKCGAGVEMFLQLDARL